MVTSKSNGVETDQTQGRIGSLAEHRTSMNRERPFTVLLLAPPTLDMQDAESGRPKPYLPKLSLAALFEWLRHHFGNNVEAQILEQAAYGISWEHIPSILRDVSPRVVGISAATFNILGAYRLARLVKETLPGCSLILGGAHASALPTYTLSECPEIDVCVIGEGEITFAEIIDWLLRGRKLYDLNSINGIAYRSRSGALIQTPRRELIGNLDVLPYLTYAGHKMSAFSLDAVPLGHPGEKWLSVQGSRGCCFNCVFCAPVLGRSFRFRDPRSIANEICWLKSTYAVDMVYFEDPCMSTNREWFIAVCRALRDSGVASRLQWGFQTRVDLVDKELLHEAVRAGCSYVNYGVESGSDLILRCNQKGFDTDTVLRAIKLTRECGIPLIHGSFVLGLPYDTSSTTRQTLQMIGEIDLNLIAVSILDVYPGTQVFAMADKGEGGMRWLPGRRLNWASYGRDTCQVEVNDLSEDILRGCYESALDTIEAKTGHRYCI